MAGENADPDYFGRDTGDASLDDPRNQDEIGENELLVVSFGTSFNDSRVEDIKAIEDALQEAYPDWSVRRAFTAQIIINHVQARDGEAIDNMEQALERAVENGVQLCLQSPVTAIGKTPGGFCVQTPRGAYEARYVFNAAGVQADEVHALLEAPGYAITPSRGEYYLMDKSQGAQVGRIIFQCPSQSGKGVLVAPTVHGNLIVGPNAEPVPDKRDVGTTGASLAYVRKTALRSVPGLNFRENIRNFAGLRAVSTRDDFILEESAASPGFFDLAGIKSPGLTSAPAIGALAVQLLRQKGVALEEKPAFRERRRAACFAALSAEEKNALIQKDARYGRVICRCETITEGEIVAALHSPIPPHSLNGVKRRCNAGMGRCQGGFCGPRVQAIIARELGIPQQEVLMDQDGTYLITGETKQGRGGVQHV